MTIDPLRVIAAFAFVIALIGICAYLLRRFGQRRNFGEKWLGMVDDASRVRVLEVRYLDARRKLVLISRDQVAHLLLLADGRETVIESGIRGKTADKKGDE